MNLVQEAVNLFIETLPLESMDVDHPMFDELYDKECQIYELFGQMTKDELTEYRKIVSSL